MLMILLGLHMETEYCTSEGHCSCVRIGVNFSISTRTITGFHLRQEIF